MGNGQVKPPPLLYVRNKSPSPGKGGGDIPLENGIPKNSFSCTKT